MKRVKRYMQRKGKTFRELVERGLERVLEEEAPEEGFVLRDAAFSGQAGFAHGVTSEDVAGFIATMNEPAQRK
jgi:hypothetical protein